MSKTILTQLWNTINVNKRSIASTGVKCVTISIFISGLVMCKSSIVLRMTMKGMPYTISDNLTVNINDFIVAKSERGMLRLTPTRSGKFTKFSGARPS